jgi:hypothetical protein
VQYSILGKAWEPSTSKSAHSAVTWTPTFGPQLELRLGCRTQTWEATPAPWQFALAACGATIPGPAEASRSPAPGIPDSGYPLGLELCGPDTDARAAGKPWAQQKRSPRLGTGDRGVWSALARDSSPA